MKFVKSLIFTLLCTSMAMLAVPVSAANNIEQRIVGGIEANSGSWPWMVALSRSSTNPSQGQFCGASLIDKDWVLTAAHCVSDQYGNVEIPGSVHAFVGAYDLSSSTGTYHQISEIIVHPDYNPLTSDNDLALLKLTTSDLIPPLNIINTTVAGNLEAKIIDPDDDVTVIGWGNTQNPDPTYPDKLHQVSMPLVSNATCNQTLGRVTDNMMCAGLYAGGVDSCQGDSGGPLVYLNTANSTWYQAGIVSWGNGCALPNGQYGVYTRVENYINWIQLAMAGITPSIQFGTWVAGNDPVSQINIDNTDGISFDITSVTSSSSSFVVGTGANACAGTVAAGTSCQLYLTFTETTAGSYSGNINITISNHPILGSTTVSVPVTGSIIEIFDVSNVEIYSPYTDWATTGNAGWFVNQVATDNTNSLQSGSITHNQRSSLFAYVPTTTGSHPLYFDWKVCSETGYDLLEVWVDGIKQGYISGDNDWSSLGVSLDGEGTHVVEWRYVKDYSDDFRSQDVGWVDNISLGTPSGNLLPDNKISCVIKPAANFNNTEVDGPIEWAVSGGATSWSEKQVSEDDSYSLQSGNISHEEKSSVYAYVNTQDSMNVYFDWKVCSEPNYDFLEVWVDGIKQPNSLSGNADWQSSFVNLPGAGKHVIEWRYSKDFIDDYLSQDAGWIDNISLGVASSYPLPVSRTACRLLEMTPAGGSGGGSGSPWLYLVVVLPLLLRLRLAQ